MGGPLTKHRWAVIARVAACAATLSIAGCARDAGTTPPPTAMQPPASGTSRANPGLIFRNASGELATLSFNEPTGAGNAVFRPSGSNGRTCATCY